MLEFLKSYGIWIVIGVFLLITLMRARGHGGCCGASHQQAGAPKAGEEKKGEQTKHSGCC